MISSQVFWEVRRTHSAEVKTETQRAAITHSRLC